MHSAADRLRGRKVGGGFGFRLARSMTSWYAHSTLRFIQHLEVCISSHHTVSMTFLHVNMINEILKKYRIT